jgi:hypothetical protein
MPNTVLDPFSTVKDFFASGLGRELALQMGQLNAIVICLDIDDEANEKTAELVKEAGGIAFA